MGVEKPIKDEAYRKLSERSEFVTESAATQIMLSLFTKSFLSSLLKGSIVFSTVT